MDLITNRKHKHKRKKSSSFKSLMERFFTSRLFLILGVLFLLTGIYYLLISYDLINSMIDIIANLLKPSDDKIIQEGHGFSTLLLYFIPAGLALISSALYSKKYSSITYSVSSFFTIYLIVVQIKIFINLFIGGCYYSNFFMASVFLFLITSVLIISAIVHRKALLLILTCVFFYISVVLFAAVYAVRFDYLFTFVLIFSFCIAIIVQKLERPYINLINFLFVTGFFSLFILRKFVANSKPEFLGVFFTFSIFFYVAFYAIALFSSNATEKQPSKWMQLVFPWSNLLFFLSGTLYIVLKYYPSESLWILVIALLLIHQSGIFLIKKYIPTAWLLPHYFAVMFLAGLVLPLILQQNTIYLFASVFSVFMFVYAENFKNRTALLISKLFLFLSMGIYLFLWINSYSPVLIFARYVLPEASFLWNGILIGMILVIMLSFTKWRLSQVNFPLPQKRMFGIRYSQIIFTFQLLSIFLTFGWFLFTVVCQLSGTLIYSSIGWFISGSLFFISMIVYYAGKHSEFKKPLLYLAFFQVLLYPVFLGWNILEEKILLSGSLNVTALVLHYIAIILFLFLGTLTIRRIYQRNRKYIILQQGVQIISIIYLAFLFITEYDILSLLVASLENRSNSGYSLGINLLSSNQYLPYSIVLFVLAMIVIFYSIFNHKSFLTKCSVVLLTGIMIKVFAYDFQTLESVERSIVFLVLGILLIGLAVLYPKIKKTTLIEVKNLKVNS